MLSEFNAEADIRGRRADLTWTWVAPGERPGLRLVRRLGEYPATVGEGLRVLDLSDVFRVPDIPWARIARIRYLVPNAVSDIGLLQAIVSLYFDPVDAADPVQVVVATYDDVSEDMEELRIEDVNRLELTQAATPPWTSVETLEVFATPGGGPEESVGQILVSTGHEDGLTPDNFEWIPVIGPSSSMNFDEAQAQQTRSTFSGEVDEFFRAEFGVDLRTDGSDFATALQLQTEEDALASLRTVTIDEAFDPDMGVWNRSAVVNDMVLEPEVVYYYALFAPDPDSPGAYLTEHSWRISVMATGHYGLDERLYELLPSVHRWLDEPDPGQRGDGQLRRLLQIVGSTFNQLRSLAEGLRQRHDVLEVQADKLAHLARWIGWEPDQTSPVHTQRNDIVFAPEIFSTVGTVPNIQALINRVTGWESQVKEFVDNVFLTNAPESIHLWEIWDRSHDGVDWGEPAQVTLTEGFDGRPTAVVNGSGEIWLIFHADRAGRREIWLQRIGVDPEPRRAMLDAPDDAPKLTYIDEYPAAATDGSGQVWLFWSSDREGAWDIWWRVFDGPLAGLPAGGPVRLTDHPADDLQPAAVSDGSGQTWLFWQSTRGGTADIWARVHDGTDWGLPIRVTQAQFRHEMPSACVTGTGDLWLFYVSDLGDRRNLFLQVFDGTDWSDPEPVTEGPQRDEAPTAVFWNGQVWLFWNSDRDGTWQIWGRIHDGTTWGDPFPVTTHPVADKEPAAVLDASGNLHLYLRSQRRGVRHRSRTIDTSDPEMLDGMGTFEDRAHYTYDTAEEDDDWYARDTVGLILAPDTDDPALVGQQTDRAKAFVEPFRPLPVRFVWLMDSPVLDELIDIDGFIIEEFSDEIE